jgi:hypothetical protein
MLSSSLDQVNDGNDGANDEYDSLFGNKISQKNIFTADSNSMRSRNSDVEATYKFEAMNLF